MLAGLWIGLSYAFSRKSNADPYNLLAEVVVSAV